MVRGWNSPVNYYGNSNELTPEMHKVLSLGENFWLVVTGNSMSPTLHHLQDRVYISPLNREPKKGDILLAELDDDHCLLHRVLKLDGDKIIFKGDALPYHEGPFSKSCIIGIVTKIERNGKIISAGSIYDKLVIRALRLIYRVYRKIKQIQK